MAVDVDLSSNTYDPILQGIDYVLWFDYASGEPLAADDKFIQTFRLAIGGPVIGKCSKVTINMTQRRAYLLVDGETTAKWFKDQTNFNESNREFFIFSTLQHTDKGGVDRVEDSGLELKYRFRVTYARVKA